MAMTSPQLRETDDDLHALLPVGTITAPAINVLESTGTHGPTAPSVTRRRRNSKSRAESAVTFGHLTPNSRQALSALSRRSLPRLVDTSASMAVSEFTVDDSSDDDFSIDGDVRPFRHARKASSSCARRRTVSVTDDDDDDDDSEFSLASPATKSLRGPHARPVFKPPSRLASSGNHTPPLSPAPPEFAPPRVSSARARPAGLPAFARPSDVPPSARDEPLRSGSSGATTGAVRRPTGPEDDPLELDDDDPKTEGALTLPSDLVGSAGLDAAALHRSPGSSELPPLAGGSVDRRSRGTSVASSNCTAAHSVRQPGSRGSSYEGGPPMKQRSIGGRPVLSGPGVPPRPPAKRVADIDS